MADDPGLRPRRVSVVGNSGSGKTTTGRALAAALAVPYVELDSIFHQPGWVELPEDEFRAKVSDAADGAGWVIDGNYRKVQDLIWGRADTVVVFDFPRPAVMRQLVRRTLRRTLTREELWNGNREPFSNLYARDPNKSILRWAWVNHDKYHRRYLEAEADPSNAHLRFIRLRSRADVARLLDAMGSVR